MDHAYVESSLAHVRTNVVLLVSRRTWWAAAYTARWTGSTRSSGSARLRSCAASSTGVATTNSPRCSSSRCVSRARTSRACRTSTACSPASPRSPSASRRASCSASATSRRYAPCRSPLCPHVLKTLLFTRILMRPATLCGYYPLLDVCCAICSRARCLRMHSRILCRPRWWLMHLSSSRLPSRSTLRKAFPRSVLMTW